MDSEKQTLWMKDGDPVDGIPEAVATTQVLERRHGWVQIEITPEDRRTAEGLGIEFLEIHPVDQREMDAYLRLRPRDVPLLRAAAFLLVEITLRGDDSLLEKAGAGDVTDSEAFDLFGRLGDDHDDKALYEWANGDEVDRG